MRTMALVSELNRLNKEVAELRDYVEKIKKHNFKDDVGIIHSKKTINNIFKKEIRRAIRHNRPLSAIIITIDNFNEIVELGKDGVANQISLMFGESIQKTIRKTDIPCKHEMDKFIIFLPETGIGLSKKVGLRIMEKINFYLEPVFECNTNIERKWGKTKRTCRVVEYVDEVSVDEMAKTAEKI